jgi:hypothetical protein
VYTTMKQHLSRLILAAVLLAACQPTAAPTNTAVMDATPTPETDASAATPEALPAGSNPTIQVTGDVSASVEANNFYVAPVKAEDETTVIGMMLYLNESDTNIVFIRFPNNATPGEYPITQGFVSENFDGTSATGNYIDQTTDPATQFAADGGTLTLTATGNTFSGAYEFTAKDEAGKSIMVTGAFVDITP